MCDKSLCNSQKENLLVYVVKKNSGTSNSPEGYITKGEPLEEFIKIEYQGLKQKVAEKEKIINEMTVKKNNDELIALITGMKNSDGQQDKLDRLITALKVMVY